MSLVIHLVYNGDVKVDRDVARLPASLDRQSAYIFPGDFMPSSRQHSILEVKFIGNQSKH